MSLRSKCHGRLLVAILVTGAMVALSQVQAFGQGAVKGVGMDAYDYASGAYAALYENGDGSAYTVAYAWVNANGGPKLLSSWNPQNRNYQAAVALRPGQSGTGTGAGTGRFAAEGWLIDFNDWSFDGPYSVNASLGVANATNVSGFVMNGLFTNLNYWTGETQVFRNHLIGNQAWGTTAGAVAIWIEGNQVAAGTGGWGTVQANTTLSRQRLR